MVECVSCTSEEAFVERLKLARQSGAVLKAKLITLRSDLPESIVLAFEGDDDKIVYGQWIRRLRPNLRYEPFPCGGKKEARGLKNALLRDLNGMGKKVYFLVDRDFDDWIGFGWVDAVFMTDMYSIENYLVSKEVLEELLRDEFPCHARPDIRAEIVSVFEKDYARFLEITSRINERIFIARQIPLELKRRLPTSLRTLATVEVGNVGPVQTAPEDIVIYDREPTPEELVGLGERFALLEAKTRYRGKFALKFFREWLNKLADNYGREDANLFSGVEGSIRRAELVLSNFASKSRLPAGLQEFVEAVG
jgi:hypothetical protein